MMSGELNDPESEPENDPEPVSATLGDVLDWSNANGVEWVRRPDGMVWVASDFELPTRLVSAVESNQSTLALLVVDSLPAPVDDGCRSWEFEIDEAEFAEWFIEEFGSDPRVREDGDNPQSPQQDSDDDPNRILTEAEVTAIFDSITIDED